MVLPVWGFLISRWPLVACADEGRLLDSCHKPFGSAWKPGGFRFLLSALVQSVAESRSLELTGAPRSAGEDYKRYHQFFIKSIKLLVSTVKLFHIKSRVWFINLGVLLFFQHFPDDSSYSSFTISSSGAGEGNVPLIISVQRATSDLHGPRLQKCIFARRL